jgi:spermidine synthase
MFGTKILEERKSKFNGNLRVVRSFGLGTYIQANGLTQSGGVVEGIWKETLKKIYNKRTPLVLKFTINNCLILGIGGGTAAKLINKFWPGAKITGVDIDPVMVELGRKYLDLDKIDIEIKIDDAFNFPKIPNHSKFDLVIVDLYRGDKFPKKFEDEKFLKSLTKNKLVIFNRLFYKEKKIEALEFGKKLQKIFDKVEYFYPVSNLMFVCSK